MSDSIGQTSRCVRFLGALASAIVLQSIAGAAHADVRVPTLTNLHSFGANNTDGTGPRSALIADAKGALYGTTLAGGALNRGTVFTLTPPVAGQGHGPQQRSTASRAGLPTVSIHLPV